MAVTTVPKVTGVLDVTSGTGVQFSHLGIGAAVANAEVVAFTLSAAIASAASAVWEGFHVNASTATISGSTNITTANGFNLIEVEAPALVGTIAVTNAASLCIIGAPSISGGGSITNADALRVVAGKSRFGGQVALADGTAGAPSVAFATDLAKGMYSYASNIIGFAIGGIAAAAINSTTFFTGGGLSLGIGGDCLIERDASDVVGFRRGAAAAQSVKIYTSFTDASNYERFGINTAAGTITLAAETAGTGSDNISLVLTTTGTGYLQTTTALAIGANPASAGVLRIPNATDIKGRNAANNGDIFVLNVSAGNVLQIGDTSGGVIVQAASGGSLAFYGTSPIAKQTGVAVTAAGIHAALVALGLFSG